MRRAIIESPYAGKTPEEIESNLTYLRAAMHDCLLRGDSPYASHGLLTQPGVLRDDDPSERALGMKAGFIWGAAAEVCFVYTERGITPGMRAGITRAEKLGIPIEHRVLDRGHALIGAAMVSPAALHELLLTIGYDVSASDLTKAAETDSDVDNAVAWARREHAIGQGTEPDDEGPQRAAPRWLEQLFSTERKP